eukprot:TRINITY_DN33_c0_g1_i1.p1 TRINITY_DN33_c0_g1~~TRINITY_DN33_c0_g1_i1.p1  ORF type:complete len:668 (+),score=117.64 TRINITY_DN33_c0_g1_i1:161-2005(+)
MNGIDDGVSRISSLIDNDGTTHLADYSFVGLGAYVVVDYTQPDVKYTLVDLSGTNDPDTGNIYSGWDRFGRVKDCRWYDYGHSTDAARLTYGFDRASDRLWRADTVAQSLGKNFDELYSYDGLHRLKDMQRGLLNSGHTAVSSENFEQCWTLDPTSNWSGFREAATGGSATLVQSRTANTVNEISGITNSVGSAWVTAAYDAAGNTTTLPQPADPTKSYTATYDAWNRLVKLVDAQSTNTVQQNAYDARSFRTKRQDYTSGTLSETRHFYYTLDWQSIEERLGTSPSSANPERQQVWGLRYIDDLVLRDRDTNGDGTLDERLYGLQDTNWNVVALINTSATAQERYQYTPFGKPTFYDGTMSTASSTSAIDSGVLFTGQQFDAKSRIYLFRNRWYEAIAGRFTTRDPLGYPDGPNAYAAWFAPGSTDPMGNKTQTNAEARDAIARALRGLCEECDCPPSSCPQSTCFAEAARIAKAIYLTLVNNWRLRIPRPWDERKYGYYCYEWAYGFEDSFKLESSGNCFTGKVEAAVDQISKRGRVHYWLAIKSVCKQEARGIFVDDGFMFASGEKCHMSRPCEWPYEWGIGNETVKPRETCTPVTPYNADGDPWGEYSGF